MKNIVYILLSLRHPKTYVGITSNLHNRLIQHNKGCNNYSRRYKPWKVVYSETYQSEKDALERENYFKSHAGRNFIKKIIKEFQ